MCTTIVCRILTDLSLCRTILYKYVFNSFHYLGCQGFSYIELTYKLTIYKNNYDRYIN